MEQLTGYPFHAKQECQLGTALVPDAPSYVSRSSTAADS